MEENKSEIRCLKLAARNKSGRMVSGFRRGLLFLIMAILLTPALGLAEGRVGPTAILNITPSGGSLKTTFIFDVSESINGRGFKHNLEYRINFDHSRTNFTNWDKLNRYTYRYTTTGEKTVILEVKDEDGLVDRTIHTIKVSETSFGGLIRVNQTKGSTNTAFRFEAIVMIKSGFLPEQYEVRLDFDGDNVYDTPFTTEKVHFYTYPRIGYYTPKMEVKDPSGNIILIIGYDDPDLPQDEVRRILIARSGHPQASISVYPTSGVASYTAFYVDASDSFDYEDLRKLEYKFDFHNDGIFETGFSEDPTADHVYAIPGTFTILVQVKDQSGMTDEAYTTVTVREVDLEPEANFSISSGLGLREQDLGTTSTMFKLNANLSRDNEDMTSKLQARWDFDNDGAYDTVFSIDKNAQHRYLSPGRKEVKLQIKDTSGNIDTFVRELTVVENTPPEARLSVTPLAGTPGTTFKINANSSTDSQYLDSYLEFRFDFNNDGVYDTDFKKTFSYSKQFEGAGRRTITLQVKDPEGQTALASIEIEIFTNTAPVAILKVEPELGTYSTYFKFDATDSYDLKPTSGKLSFRWDMDYTGESDINYDTTFSSIGAKNHRFNKTGTRKIKVEVQDEDGEMASAIREVYLHWASGYLEELRKKGVFQGYLGGDMRPTQPITRAELAKIILKAKGISTSRINFSDKFTDVTTRDWFWRYVLQAEELGIVQGYGDGSFRPNQSVNRAEALKMILEAFEVDLVNEPYGVFPDVRPSVWYAGYIDTASRYDLVQGYPDGYFRPYNQITRGEAAKIVYLAWQKFNFGM